MACEQEVSPVEGAEGEEAEGAADDGGNDADLGAAAVVTVILAVSGIPSKRGLLGGQSGQKRPTKS